MNREGLSDDHFQGPLSNSALWTRRFLVPDRAAPLSHRPVPPDLFVPIRVSFAEMGI